MNDLIQLHKDYLTRCIKGYDSSLKAKGVTLFSILKEIDKNTDISDEDIKRRFNIFFNKTMLILRRTNQSAKASWLEGNVAHILKYLYIYSDLSRSVYKTDDSLISWYRKNHSEDGSDLVLLDENDLGSFLFIHNDNFYSVEIISDSETMNRHVSISNVYHPDNELSKRTYITYAFDYETFPHEDDEMFHHQSNISVMCSNTTCPRWKQSQASVYNDGAKTVFCNLEDCSRCSGFTECGVLRPMDALTVVKAIYKCMLTREYTSNSKDLEPKEYEHIPLPQREDDVVIYFGEPKRSKSFEEIGLVPVSRISDTGIVSSHASPREHHRRGGNRRAYVRKDGVKVRETTFKETIVNRGNTKTTYTLKERK